MSPTFRRQGRRSNTRRTFFGATRAAWMSSRARNALRRPVFIAAVSIGVFATALMALIAVPQQAKREARLAAAGLDQPVDTMQYVRALVGARSRLVTADSALASTRALAAQAAAANRPPAPVGDSLAPGGAGQPGSGQVVAGPAAGSAERDALAERVLALGRLIERVESSPLPISYRALAESPEVRDDGRVRALVDTLTEVEREREAFGAVGGVDPIFVALTSRVNDIGRAIQGIAEERRTTLTTELAALVPRAPAAQVAVVQADTAAQVRERLTAQTVFDSTRVALDRARAQAQESERQRRALEAQEGGAASPLALLAAALVIGAVLGFGAAFGDELRRPRLADAAEAERVTGLRVLGVIRPRRTFADRARRGIDTTLPQYIDPQHDGHQLAYLHVATASQGTLTATVTGDEPAVAAIVAANLAAVSAEEARNTLVVDTDAAACELAAALQIPAEPGFVEVVDGRTRWSEVTQLVQVGRNSSIDAVASGTAVPAPGYEEVAGVLRESSERLMRHYDSVIVVAPVAHVVAGLPTTLPMPLVVYCARVGHTRVNELRTTLEAIREAGGQAVGIVVWDDAAPSLPTPEALSSRSRRPQRTSEHRVAAEVG